MALNICDNQKTVGVIFPQAIKDNADFVGGLDSTPVTIDTQGYNELDIYVMFGSIDATVADFEVHESDDDNTYTAVDGLDFTSDTSAPGASDDNTIYRAHIPLKGRKRYYQVDLKAGDGASGTYAVSWATLSNPSIAPENAADRGLEDELSV